MTLFYDDGQVTLYCADFRAVDVAAGSVAAVVTSPPYNVGLDYDATSDVLAWPEYWSLAADAAALMAGALVDGGRAWVNTAVSVPAQTRTRVARARGAVGRPGSCSLTAGAGCSRRRVWRWWIRWRGVRPGGRGRRGGRGSPRRRRTCAATGNRSSSPAPAAGNGPHRSGCEGWRDTVGAWPSLCSTVWNLAPARRAGHPAPFPVEVARRAIRLSTWPDEIVLDPFAGSGFDAAGGPPARPPGHRDRALRALLRTGRRPPGPGRPGFPGSGLTRPCQPTKCKWCAPGRPGVQTVRPGALFNPSKGLNDGQA